ncbi:MAG: integrase arm-type DNA-binding domain-containing protein [Pseudomonadota bacterium]
MARGINRLTDLKVKRASKPGRYGDGNGLFLRIFPSGRKSWVFRWLNPRKTTASKRDEIAIGQYPDVSLALAREIVADHRKTVANGGDPRAVIEAKSREPTFFEAAEAYIALNEPEWRNDKHVQQWRNSIKTYCNTIGNMPVSQIQMRHVVSDLSPIWLSKAETARRLRARIERVLARAEGEGWREGPNPATYYGSLKEVLPKHDKRAEQEHHAALPYDEIQSFIQELRARKAVAARALEFCIFTVGRTGEVLNATWDEIDLNKALWKIPASRMKNKREHVVPLTQPALDVLTPLYEARQSEWVFPGLKKGRPPSQMAMLMMLRRMERDDITAHGFRSTFRDWCADRTGFEHDAVEGCLAHRVGSKVELAYKRSTSVDKRRVIMSAWADFCTGADTGKIVTLRHG